MSLDEKQNTERGARTDAGGDNLDLSGLRALLYVTKNDLLEEAARLRRQAEGSN